MTKHPAVTNESANINLSPATTPAVSATINIDTGETAYAFYGNWCGPDHPKDINHAQDPIDQLDAACMRHDYCYANKGYLDCDCDKNMNAEIKQDLNAGVYTRNQILIARNIHRYFSASPCDGNADSKIAPSRAAHKIYNHVKNRVNGILDRIMPGND